MVVKVVETRRSISITRSTKSTKNVLTRVIKIVKLKRSSSPKSVIVRRKWNTSHQ